MHNSRHSTGSGDVALTRRVAAQLRRTAVGTGSGAKEAATAFRRLALSPDGSRSLVACRPLTGRTHQARSLWHAINCA